MQRRIWCQEHGNSPASCNGASGVRNTEIRPHHACTAEFAFIHSFIHSLTHSLMSICRAQYVENAESEALIGYCSRAHSIQGGDVGAQVPE